MQKLGETGSPSIFYTLV